jgi:hypothetical protein
MPGVPCVSSPAISVDDLVSAERDEAVRELRHSLFSEARSGWQAALAVPAPVLPDMFAFRFPQHVADPAGLDDRV